MLLSIDGQLGKTLGENGPGRSGRWLFLAASEFSVFPGLS